MISAIFNRAWLLSGYRDYAYFKHNMYQVAKVQSRKMLSLLQTSQHTLIGNEYKFQKIKDYHQFAETIPLLENYDVLKSYIDRIANGEENILFPGKPLFFETTSGSTSMSKLIPYNEALKREFQTGVHVWMNDLFRRYSDVFNGPAYWSVSPAMKAGYRTLGGIPVGTTTDSAYFNRISAWFMDFMLVLPPEGLSGASAHAFYVATWRRLIQCRELRFISVWSPNFLLRFYAFLQEHVREILMDDAIPKRRKEEVEYICRESFTFQDLFPKLRLLSCWTQAQAQLWMNEVKDVLGDVEIQGKGLLSTEGIVSIPFQKDHHVLAYTSHFYEFREVESGRILLAEALELEGVYEVILTTGGGLYRYCTGDLVRCTGYQLRLPCLEFIGRGNSVSDMVGEKLNANVLPTIFSKVKNQHPERVKALFLYAQVRDKQGQYLLLISGEIQEQEADSIAKGIQKQLQANPYFDQAIANGQLLPLKPILLEPGFPDQLFEFYCREHRIKDGDAKLPLLFKPGALKDLLDF